MIITATEEQVIDAACKAVAASIPVGVGIIHYNPKDDNPNRRAVASCLDNTGMYIDYFKGRMVKFTIIRKGPNTWSCDDMIRGDYQSWAVKYPTYADLFKE